MLSGMTKRWNMRLNNTIFLICPPIFTQFLGPYLAQEVIGGPKHGSFLESTLYLFVRPLHKIGIPIPFFLSVGREHVFVRSILFETPAGDTRYVGEVVPRKTNMRMGCKNKNMWGTWQKLKICGGVTNIPITQPLKISNGIALFENHEIFQSCLSTFLWSLLLCQGMVALGA